MTKDILHFPGLIPNTTNIDRYNPYKQRLVHTLNTSLNEYILKIEVKFIIIKLTIFKCIIQGVYTLVLLCDHSLFSFDISSPQSETPCAFSSHSPFLPPLSP